MSVEDGDRLFTQLFLFDHLQFKTDFGLYASEDPALQIRDFYDENLPRRNWRLEQDWWQLGEYSSSRWRIGDKVLNAIVFDNLTSMQVNDFERYFGILELEAGGSFIVLYSTDYSASLATETPVPVPASENTSSEPTNVPNTSGPVVEQKPNTPSGMTLAIGEEWYQDGMAARIKNQTFLAECGGFLEFEMTIANMTNTELVVNISGNDFSFTDDHGQSYSNSNIWWDYGPNEPYCHPYRLSELTVAALGAGERIDIAIRVLGNPSNSVEDFYFIIFRAGRIENAQWIIEVPR